MRTITFTPEDLRDLAHDRYNYPDPRVQRKMEVLWLKSHGLSHDAIAAYADVSRRTVQRYLDQYLEGGLPRLRRCEGNHPHSILVEHETSLEEYFQKHPPRSVKQARAIIEQRTGVRRGLSQVRHFLKDHLGLRWRQVGAIPVPPKKTVQEHAQEQATYVEEGGAGATPGAGPPGPEAGLLRGRRPLRLGAVPGLLVVCGTAVRACGLGSQALQCPGGVGRGDAPSDPGDQ